MLAGCEDYLDVKPRGYDVAEKVSHYEGLLYGTETIMLDEVFPYMCFEWETNSEAYENVYSLISVIPAGSVIAFSPLHSVKARSPIRFTPSGKLIPVRPEQYANV